jgi:hypothetical protein
MTKHLARMWRGTRRQVQTTDKARVYDLGLLRGAGDGNRTRALSLGIAVLLGVVGDLTSGNGCQGEALGSPWHPLLTVAYRPVGHASGTDTF